MLRRTPSHDTKQVHARLECNHRGLVEHPARNVIEQMPSDLNDHFALSPMHQRRS
jgi:hypothetical protein